MKGFKQFVPSGVCLACDGCCRFAEDKSCWSVKISSGEKKTIEGKKEVGKIFTKAVVDEEGFLSTISFDGNLICCFLNSENNTCGVYHARPFECQLYPFLLAKREEKNFIALHLSCPYIQDNRDAESLKSHTDYLENVFKEAAVVDFLEGYMDLFRNYSQFDSEIEYLFEI